VLHFDPSRLNWRFAVLATFVVIGLIGAGMAFGGTGVAAVMGFLLTFVAWSAEEGRTWRGLTVFGSAGTVIGLLAFVVSEDVLASSLLLGGVSYLASLAAFVGTGSKTRWSLLALWALIALLVADSEATVRAGIGFAVGFGLSAVLLILARGSPGDRSGTGSTGARTQSLAGVVSGASVASP
jgi:hypothetical protein